MTRPPLLSVTEARAAPGYLHAAAQAADPTMLAPLEWIKRLHDVVRSIAPREEQHHYRRSGFHKPTMGQLHRHVVALLSDFDGLVEDNPRLSRKAQ